MNNILKKIVAIATIASSLVMMAGPAMAITIEELEAQIANLLATLTSLQSQLAELKGEEPTGVCPCTFTRNLYPDMSGDDVKCLQEYLNDTGYKLADSGAGSPGSETTYFGPLTRAAVKAWQDANGVEYGDWWGYFGPKSQVAYDGLCAVPTECTTAADCPTNYVCTAGKCVYSPPGALMSVALAADTPTAANLWRGSANNVVAKLTFYGGTSAVSITSLTLTSYGTTEATYSGTTTGDIPAVKIFDESNIQLGTDRTIIGNKANFVFVPAITVPVNSSRTVSVAVNIGSNAQVMGVVRLGLKSATDISGATFSGTFPITGNQFTIVPAGSIGSITVGQFGSLPKTTVKIGEKDIVLEKFTVSAGANEDIELNQATVKNSTSATISDSDISNIRIREVGGAVIAGPATLSAKKATINFATPYSLTKGMAKNFEVIADIVSGDTRTVMLYIDTGGVVGRGKLSGVNITSSGAATTANTVTIGKGALTVSMSSNHPQGSAALMIKTTNIKTIAQFSVRALGEEIILSTINVQFDAANNLSTTSYLSGVGLYDGDALVSDLKTVNSEVADPGESFSLNWTIPANTTKEMAMKAVTNNLGTDTSYTSTTTWSGYSGFGLSSGEVISSTSDVTSTAVTIYQSGTATLTADTTKTPADQGILVPANNVTLGALKVYAQREDQRLNKLVVTPSTTAKLSSLTIYDETGTDQLSNPITESGGVFTFTTTDLLEDVIFYKGVYKTILLKGNTSATQSDLSLSIATAADQFETMGVDSGAEFDYASGLAFKFTSPFAGGEFELDSKIVEIQKRGNSPSGTIGRATESVVARWDINAITNDVSSRTITAITFTSKTGLPSGASATGLYRLYEEGDISLGYASSVSVANGTITFSGLSLVAPFGINKEIYLVVDTRSSTIWPSGSEMLWTVYVQADMTVTTGTVGFGGTVYSIPADANKVKVSGV